MILDQMMGIRPKDSLCLIAITADNLFSGDLNFVFGEATLREGFTVLSMHRLGRPGTPDFLLRMLKIVAHETGHVFGITHCARWECCLSGSNSLGETDLQPVHLCPDDLEKLRFDRGFEVEGRYRQLERIYRDHGLTTQADWIQARLADRPED